MPPVSKKQARFFGAIAGGRIKRKGISQATAREFLRGSKIKNLPTRKRSKKSKRR